MNVRRSLVAFRGTFEATIRTGVSIGPLARGLSNWLEGQGVLAAYKDILRTGR